MDAGERAAPVSFSDKRHVGISNEDRKNYEMVRIEVSVPKMLRHTI